MFVDLEKSISKYLKSHGIRMKTDPRAKQDRYYAQIKRKGQKALTVVHNQTEASQSPDQFLTPSTQARKIENRMMISMNSIMQRRTP